MTSLAITAVSRARSNDQTLSSAGRSGLLRIEEGMTNSTVASSENRRCFFSGGTGSFFMERGGRGCACTDERMIPQRFDDFLPEEAVHFDVGGQHYWTCAGTLKNIPKVLDAKDRGCFFEKILQNAVSDTVKIDRDGSTFAWVLNYVRSGNLPSGLEDLVLLGQIAAEACFFGLHGLAEKVTEMARVAADRRAAEIERERKIEWMLAQVLEQLSERSVGGACELKESVAVSRERRSEGGSVVEELSAEAEVYEAKEQSEWGGSELEGGGSSSPALRVGCCSEDEDEVVRKEWLGADPKVVEMFGLSQPKFSEDVDF